MDELQRVAQALADRIGLAVAIDDPQMNLICHTAHDDHIDRHRISSIMKMRAPDEVVAHAVAQGIATAEGPVRVAGRPEIELLPRICFPVRCQGLLFGYLWIIEPAEGLPADEVQAAAKAAADAGQLLFRERLVDDLRDSRERELLRDLISDDPAVSSAAADLLADEEMLPPACSVAVLVVQASSAEQEDLRTTLHAVLRRAGRRATPLVSLSMARAGGRGVLLLAGRRPPGAADLRGVAEQVQDELVKQLGDSVQVRVGIGPVVDGPTRASVSARRAREALDVTQQVTGFGTVTAWDDLGVYRLLVQLPLSDLPEDAIPDGLRTLMESDHEGTLAETLETWLDEGCDSRHTVARLQVHRTSLYYRLGRIEEITGLSLKSGGVRLDLHLGLKLARLQGLIGR
ncbi:helix-turn-helix domain-containing protein [Streptosporangium sp. NPDC006013]|uniref:PucR family transcriptional regulator n=1 Tax=Streptosporangium sp. NPDC006013 TaxID=3155596 RepID=UPI00339EEC86